MMNKPPIGDSRCVFVVGLPRSGSTLLSRILNESPDVLSVNDLYYLQAVLALQARDGPLPPQAGAQLLAQLLRLIRIRSSENNEFIGQFDVPDACIGAVRREATAAIAAGTLDWAGLMDLVLSRVAQAAGKTRWADKTPQNFFHVELLRERFPAARFVFLLRDPRDIMASYKFVQGDGHDVRRYHPLAYAFYWRSAARRYLALADSADVTMLRYEDLRERTAEACARLGAFLDTPLHVGDIARLGHNSSFTGGRRRAISPTEAWLCERICGAEMQRLGYAPSPQARLRLADLPYLLSVSGRFMWFQLRRALGSADARARIGSYLRALTRRGAVRQPT